MNERVEDGVARELARAISLEFPGIYYFAVEQLGSLAGSKNLYGFYHGIIKEINFWGTPSRPPHI